MTDALAPPATSPPLSPLYRITDWASNFERNRTREVKVLSWVALPIRHDGDGYTELVDHPHGAAHFGVWVAIVQVAAKCDPRGTLLRDGRRPHDAASLARITRLPSDVISEAIPRLIAIGWLEQINAESPAKPTISQDDATLPQEGAAMSQGSAPTVHNSTVHNRTREKTAAAQLAPSSASQTSEPTPGEISAPAEDAVGVLTFPVAGPGEKSWALTEKKLAEYQESFPSLDVLAACRAARQWVRDNHPKTAKGMPRFLAGWLSRSQDRRQFIRTDATGTPAAKGEGFGTGFVRRKLTDEDRKILGWDTAEGKGAA